LTQRFAPPIRLYFLSRFSNTAFAVYGIITFIISWKIEELPMTLHATGTFEVKLVPQTPSEDESAAVGRMSLDKQFSGDLAGTSKGIMLAVGTAVEGSAGYVAMEQFTGKLSGKSGTFALQHSGTMARGAQQLSISVVPDSGTGDLVGLSGQMAIQIDDGKHSYDFEYSL
jgi:hypothetical protein